MDELPELPLEKVLSYLTLDDLFKSRAVCRAWCNLIDRFRVKCLCYSERPSGLIFSKHRLVGGIFAASFVRSSSFESFFSTYGQSILSSLKKLRLCALHLPISSIKIFASTIQSFDQLEHLSIIKTYFGCDRENRFANYDCDSRSFELNMPMLESLHFEKLYGLRTLTLDAPRLRSITFKECDLNPRLELVHADSVEWLDTDLGTHLEVKKLKNLKYLFQDSCIFPTNHATNEQFLSNLVQLKELHLTQHNTIWELFEQRHRYGLADLKFYLLGCLANGPDDPVMNYIICHQVRIDYLAENPSRMADYIPFTFDFVAYPQIEHVSLEVAITLLNRCSNVVRMNVFKPVQDIERFLYVLKNSNYIAELKFFNCPEGQPQELFDRVPEHCAVQKLEIDYVPSNLDFLLRLKHLIALEIVGSSISVEIIRKVFEELPFLSVFNFFYANKGVTIQNLNKKFRIEDLDEFETRKGIRIYVSGKGDEVLVGDLNAAIQFVTSLQEAPKE